MADTAYQTESFRCEAGLGINARHIYDAPPKGTWLNLDNLESREEGALSSRFGLAALTTDGATQNFPLGAPVNSLGRMQGIGTPYRYAGTTGGKLFRRAGNGVGAFSQIATGLSGGRASMAPYRPANSSAPWQFVADSAKLVKDNGTLAAAQNWGIAPPVQPALIAPLQGGGNYIDPFDTPSFLSSYTIVNVGSAAFTGRVSTAIGAVAAGIQLATITIVIATTLTRAAGVTTVVCSANHNYRTGMRVAVLSATGSQSFLVSSVIITVTNPTTFTYPNPGANQAATNGSISALPSFTPGMLVQIGPGIDQETVYVMEVTNTGFVASFALAHAAGAIASGYYLGGTVAANTTATISFSPLLLNVPLVASEVEPLSDLIQISVLLSNPLAVSEIKIIFDVGDASFGQDYYYKSIIMSTAQPSVSGTRPGNDVQSGAVAQRAGGILDVRTVGVDSASLLPTDLPILQQLQPAAMTPGVNVWSFIQVRLSEFVAVGAAGNPGRTWANVTGWRVQFKTNPTLTTTIGIDDFMLTGGSDLDSFAGQPYDYRYTYYNINTGAESTPSRTMVATDPNTFNSFLGAFLPVPLSVRRQKIIVQPLQPTDPQVTHIRIYRRGGTLTQAWYYVDKIAVGTTTFTDAVADSIIINNDQLNVSADPPVTALLPTPLDSTISVSGVGAPLGPGMTTVALPGGMTVYPGQLVTIDSGNFQEQVYVSAVTLPHIDVYLQFNHGGDNSSTKIAATTRPQVAMNLAAIAFDQAYLAGDANNPHILYYSKPFTPETFPQQNFIEVGTPDAPIMALVVLRGLLYVFTTKTVWQIFGGSGSTPLAVPTGVMHGLVANWAWAATENAVYYLSYDGVYLFTGSGSTYLTQNTEWIWTSRTETGGVIPVLDQAQKSNVFMAYGNHEVFVAYEDAQLDITHRQIGHDLYQRWRNDDQGVGSITAMFFEQDTGQLIVGKDDGMVYIDRVNNYDSGGWNGAGEIQNPIPVNLQTPQLDLGVAKAFKQWNELTIDANIPLATVITVTALFDNGTAGVALGAITGTGVRTQYQVNIGSGLGRRSLNMGLKLTGSTLGQVIFHEIHVRALVEAEYRQSFDFYKLDFGSASWKFWKQMWAVYSAPDAAGIACNLYVDDSPVPSYSFTLPSTGSSNTRTTVKVRFPALKGRILRVAGTSPTPFQMYSQDTEVEWKDLTAQKGYTRQPIVTQ